jgi:hypothetical protein
MPDPRRHAGSAPRHAGSAPKWAGDFKAFLAHSDAARYTGPRVRAMPLSGPQNAPYGLFQRTPHPTPTPTPIGSFWTPPRRG